MLSPSVMKGTLEELRCISNCPEGATFSQLGLRKSVEYVIKNKGEVTPTVVGRLSDVEQTYGVGSIRYCFAPIAVIGRVQSPRLLSTQVGPSQPIERS